MSRRSSLSRPDSPKPHLSASLLAPQDAGSFDASDRHLSASSSHRTMSIASYYYLNSHLNESPPSNRTQNVTARPLGDTQSATARSLEPSSSTLLSSAPLTAGESSRAGVSTSYRHGESSQAFDDENERPFANWSDGLTFGHTYDQSEGSISRPHPFGDPFDLSVPGTPNRSTALPDQAYFGTGHGRFVSSTSESDMGLKMEDIRIRGPSDEINRATYGTGDRSDEPRPGDSVSFLANTSRNSSFVMGASGPQTADSEGALLTANQAPSGFARFAHDSLVRSPDEVDRGIDGDQDTVQKGTFAYQTSAETPLHLEDSLKHPFEAQGDIRSSSDMYNRLGINGPEGGGVERAKQGLNRVGKSIRRLSRRVVNLDGNERPTKEGMIMLPNTQDDDSSSSDGDDAIAVQELEYEPAVAGLRGKSLGLFGPSSLVRRSLASLMSQWWIEPLILLMILFNVVLLIIQSSRDVFKFPLQSGYFDYWVDYALLSVFVVYTVEIVSRIIVSGLVVNPPAVYEAPRDQPDADSSPIETPIAQHMRGHPARSNTLNTFADLGQSIKQRAAELVQPHNHLGQISKAHQHGAHPLSPNRAHPPRTASSDYLQTGVLDAAADQPADSHLRGRRAARQGTSTIPSIWEDKTSKFLQKAQLAPFAEAIMKQRAQAIDYAYLRHSWNRIDLIAVVAFWTTFFLSVSHAELQENLHLRIFRALSVLRCARLLTATRGTSVILRSLKTAGPLLVNVAFFTLFTMLLFSVIGVQSFEGNYRRSCVFVGDLQPQLSASLAGQNATLSQICGGYLDAVTGQRRVAETEGGQPLRLGIKGYICPRGQVCVEASQNPENNAESFDNVFTSLLQVIIVISSNGWSGIMYNMMDADYYASCLYFIIGMIIMNFWMANLFVAVITNTFASISAETKQSAFAAERIEVSATKIEQVSAAGQRRKRVANVFKRFWGYTKYFWLALIVADLGVQASQASYHQSAANKRLDLTELYLTIAFDVEILLRFLSYLLDNDWRGFFAVKRNRFDTFLAVITTIIQIPAIKFSPVFPWLTVFQLARFYRVIAAVPRMEVLLIRVFGSLSGLFNMILFLFLMVGLASLIAAQLFRGDVPQEDDDGELIEINFKQMWNSFLGMYQIFSSENWTTPLYNVLVSEGQYQQAVIAGIFLCVWFLFANFILLQMFIAVIAENFGVAESQKRTQQLERYLRNLEKPRTALIVRILHHLSPYRWLRARNAAMMGETEKENDPQNRANAQRALDAMDEKTRQRASRIPALSPLQVQRGFKAIRRFLHLDKPVEQVPLDTLRARQFRQSFSSMSMLNDRRQQSLSTYSDLMGGASGSFPTTPGVQNETPQDSETARIFARDRQLNRMRTDLGLIREETPSQTRVNEMHVNRWKDDPRMAQARLINSHPSYEKSLWLFSNTNQFRRICQSIVPCSYGERLFGRKTSNFRQRIYQLVLIATIAASVIIAGIATPLYRRDWYSEHGYRRNSWFSMTEIMLSLIFIAEFFLKVIADGFAFTPNAYLLSPWNALDLFVLITLVVNVSTELAVIGGVSRFTRALKAFRALRLINLSDFMRRTFSGLIAVSGRFIDASVLAILYIVPFAIWGQNLFSGLLYSCTDSSAGISNKADCIGEYGASPSEWTFLAPRSWQNPTEGSVYSFDDFRSSLLILFEIVSLEGWTNVMSTAMSVTGYNQQLQPDNRQINALFFVVYNLIGAVFVLTLFVAVIIESFQAFSGAAYFTTAQRQWIDLKRLIKRQRPSKRPKVQPTGKWRFWCYERAVHKHGWWSRSIAVLYFASLITLATQQYRDVQEREVIRDIIYISLAVIFAIDILVRLFGIGWRAFRQDWWNLFDLIVVTGLLATSIPLLTPSTSNQANIQMQKFFLVAVAFKLVQKINSLNQLFKTAVSSLPSIASLFLVWLTIFLVWGIMLVEVFGLTAWGINETYNINFTSLLRALVFLSMMSTGEGWNSFMHDFTVSSPMCTASQNYLATDCGSEGWAYFLFIGWNVISMYIFLNMFTATVVENFSYVFQLGGKPTLSREQVRNFKKAWAEMDVHRTGYLQKDKFVAFFNKLEGALEVRVYSDQASIKTLKNKAMATKPGQRPSFDHSSRGSRSPTRGAAAALANKLRLRSPLPGKEDDDGNDSSQFLWPPSPSEIVVDGVNIASLNRQLNKIDHAEIRRRRHRFERLYNEACLLHDRPQNLQKGGLSFTDVLTLLAHYKLIDDVHALSVEELVERRELLQCVEDRIETQKVRSILRQIWLRRRFLAMREARHTFDGAEGADATIFADKGKERMLASHTLSPIPGSPTQNVPAINIDSSMTAGVGTKTDVEDSRASPAQAAQVQRTTRTKPALHLDLGSLSSRPLAQPARMSQEVSAWSTSTPSMSPMSKVHVLREGDDAQAQPSIHLTAVDDEDDDEDDGYPNNGAAAAGLLEATTSPKTPTTPGRPSQGELSPSPSLQELQRIASPVIHEIDTSAWGTLARRLSEDTVAGSSEAGGSHREQNSQSSHQGRRLSFGGMGALRSRLAGIGGGTAAGAQLEESHFANTSTSARQSISSAGGASGTLPEMSQSDQSSTASFGNRSANQQPRPSHSSSDRGDWI